jgi:putative flippase GtrA
MNVELTRLVRFGVVGASNTLLTLLAFTLLAAAGVAPPLASGLAFATGAANGYLLNSAWTFRGAPRGPATLARYVAVQAVGALSSAAGVAIASHLALQRLAAEGIVLPLVTLITYLLARTVVFRTSTLA